MAIDGELLKSTMLDVLDETFEHHHGVYLDRGTSLLETLRGIDHRQASIPVGGGCATLAAQVAHVTFYLEVLERELDGGSDEKVDWDEIWRTVGAVTAEEWDALRADLERTYRRIDERLRAAVNQGGPAHFAFQKDWIAKAQRGEYPFELAETLACAFDRSSGEEWIEYAPQLSLLTQGILDRPCAPLLCVNGVNDTVFPIADMYLLLEHGRPKSTRFYPGGHMGGGNAQAVIIDWLKEKLMA